MKYKKINLIFFLIMVFLSPKLYALENKILFKINNEIITTVDLFKESQYLALLNPNLNKLERKKIYEISKNSLIREKIKEIELKKNIRILNIDEKYFNQLMENYSKRMGFVSEKEFKNYIEINNLEIENIKKKIKYEVLWNQLIVKKFLKEIKIDKKQIMDDLKKNNKQTEYFLSEIVFNIKNKSDLKKKFNVIKDDIRIKGFANAALIHGVSDTSKNGGKLGWIKKSSLNSKIQNQISKTNVGNITDPIIIAGGFLILKINDKRLTDKEINLDDEIKSIIDAKTNEQLNRLSITYFNKIKKNIQINEL